MLVYGDRRGRRSTAAMRQRVRRQLARGLQGGPGIGRHGAIGGALIEAGELVQGLLDWQLEQLGVEEFTELTERCAALLDPLAGLLTLSFDQGMRGPRGDGALALRGAAEVALTALGRSSWPEAVTVVSPEGYAIYGVYPEAYLLAARRAGQAPPVRVIGLRSIGTSLAAVVARGLGAVPPVCSVRPQGHPFARAVRFGGSLAPRLLAGGSAMQFAVVDEGPGLSGSSLAAVADALVKHRIPRQRVHFYPGHPGPLGHAAPPARRRHWTEAARHCVDVGELLAGADPRFHLGRWVQGPCRGPGRLEDVGAGRWRQWLLPRRQWPGIAPHMERRKYLWTGRDGAQYLLKFIGLGRHGQRLYRRARWLGDAGICPPALAWRYGFLVQPWYGDARPLSAAGETATGLRADRIEQVGAYLRLRAQRLPVRGGARGASPRELLAMAETNVREGLGAGWAAAVRSWGSVVRSLAAAPRRVETDNKMHAWEWLLRPDGRLIKTDAVEHHAGHDLVGCQHIAWDVAGALVELELAPAESGRLIELLGGAGGELHAPLLSFHLLAYLAFQLGFHEMAAHAAATFDVEEAGRLSAQRHVYAAKLRHLLAGGVPRSRSAAPPALPGRAALHAGARLQA